MKPAVIADWHFNCCPQALFTSSTVLNEFVTEKEWDEIKGTTNSEFEACQLTKGLESVLSVTGSVA